MLEGKKYKTVTLYDAERNDTHGKGYHTKKWNLTKYNEDEINEKIEQLRTDQKRKNIQYRLKQREENDEKLLLMSGQKEKYETPLRFHNLPVMESELDLKLDLNTGNTTIIFGSSKMGKSTLLMYLYDKYYKHKDWISFLYSINSHIGIYKDHDNLIICNTFNKDAERMIMEQKYINHKTNNHYKFCNILDDIIDVKFSKLINNLVMTYRNSNISSLVSLQYPKLLNRGSRANVNNIILFNFVTDETCIDAIKLYCRSFFNKMGYKSEADQLKLYKELTKNHGFIYINVLNNHISFHRLNI